MTDADDQDDEGYDIGGTTEDVSSTRSYDLDRDDPSVVVVSGPDSGLEVGLDDEPTVVGRARGADLQIDDNGVSSRHLKLFEQSSSIWVDDLDSSNGTYVNGERIVSPRELLEGDTIGIGRETLICLTIGDEGASEDDETTIRVGRDANWFQVADARAVDLRRRKTVRRLLYALIEAADDSSPEPLDVHELFEIGWPDDQHLEPDAAAQRVYVAIRTLRREGLSGILVTGDDGYYLAPDMVSIEREPESTVPPS